MSFSGPFRTSIVDPLADEWVDVGRADALGHPIALELTDARVLDSGFDFKHERLVYRVRHEFTTEVGQFFRRGVFAGAAQFKFASFRHSQVLSGADECVQHRDLIFGEGCVVRHR